VFAYSAGGWGLIPNEVFLIDISIMALETVTFHFYSNSAFIYLFIYFLSSSVYFREGRSNLGDQSKEDEMVGAGGAHGGGEGCIQHFGWEA
jgi:hypothetical protein